MKKILFILVSSFICFTSKAQESVNTSGGNASGSGGTVSFSIGQVAYTYNTGSSGNVSQGVQYAYEIFTNGISETELNISLSAFPNPTAEYLNLQIGNFNKEQLSFQLFDLRGNLLISEQIVAQLTQIDMNTLPSAGYILNVVNQENKKIQSYKIIKH